MACDPNDISTNLGDIQPATAIPGFGIPFAMQLPNDPVPANAAPEFLQGIYNVLSFIIPPGTMQPALAPNFGKDAFDGAMKLLDHFMPFIMMYKFFMPMLNIIVGIIEVICSLLNPFALFSAVLKLFRKYIPEFLNIFPAFAIIIMIISIGLLLLEIITYILNALARLVVLIERNINALYKNLSLNNAQAVGNIIKKLSAALCAFNNLFVIFSYFAVFIDVIKAIIKAAVPIPPCDDGTNGEPSPCCTPDVCPAIIKNGDYTNSTGNFKYLNAVKSDTGVSVYGGNLLYDVRPESWQIYDTQQTIEKAFINIVNAYDVDTFPKPVFFPTDSVYSKDTPIQQAPYRVDLKLYYDPISFGRPGLPRFIIFKDCIVTKVTSPYLSLFDNSVTPVNTGVLSLAGGLGYLIDGVTPLTGYAADGITAIANQATLENFLHFPQQVSVSPILTNTDGYEFQAMEYTFKINHELLVKKNIITTSCFPRMIEDKALINLFYGSAANTNLILLNNLIDSPTFFDIAGAQECVAVAVAGLTSNLNQDQLNSFNNTVTACLTKLKEDVETNLTPLVLLGFDQYSSTFEIDPTVQFVSQPIKVKVYLKDTNGALIARGLNASIGTSLSEKFVATLSLGEISPFTYDGISAFEASILSKDPGGGTLSISFDGKEIGTITIPADTNIAPSASTTSLAYTYISSAFDARPVATATGDVEGTPARNESDIADEVG